MKPALFVLAIMLLLLVDPWFSTAWAQSFVTHDTLVGEPVGRPEGFEVSGSIGARSSAVPAREAGWLAGAMVDADARWVQKNALWRLRSAWDIAFIEGTSSDTETFWSGAHLVGVNALWRGGLGRLSLRSSHGVDHTESRLGRRRRVIGPARYVAYQSDTSLGADGFVPSWSGGGLGIEVAYQSEEIRYWNAPIRGLSRHRVAFSPRWVYEDKDADVRVKGLGLATSWSSVSPGVSACRAKKTAVRPCPQGAYDQPLEVADPRDPRGRSLPVAAGDIRGWTIAVVGVDALLWGVFLTDLEFGARYLSDARHGREVWSPSIRMHWGGWLKNFDVELGFSAEGDHTPDGRRFILNIGAEVSLDVHIEGSVVLGRLEGRIDIQSDSEMPDPGDLTDAQREAPPPHASFIRGEMASELVVLLGGGAQIGGYYRLVHGIAPGAEWDPWRADTLFFNEAGGFLRFTYESADRS